MERLEQALRVIWLVEKDYKNKNKNKNKNKKNKNKNKKK
jgi:hypothetical protein